MPNMARLARGCRGRLVPPPGQLARSVYFWVNMLRAPALVSLEEAKPIPILSLPEALSRSGDRVVSINWPAPPGIQIFPVELPAPAAALVLDTPPAQLDPTLLVRLGQDRGAVRAAIDLFEKVTPRALIVGLAGPFDVKFAPDASFAVSPPATYWSLLDATIGRLLAAMPPDSVVLVLGRGLGLEGTPAAEGVFLGTGGALASAPATEEIRATDVGASLLALCGDRLPIGAAGEPSPVWLDPAWLSAHPTRWELEP
jgi:hypothetical protein